jgi:hypothetical protein
MLQAALHPLSYYSDKTMYILYRILNKHINYIIVNKSDYFIPFHRAVLGYYVCIMKDYYKIDIKDISNTTHFTIEQCEQAYIKFDKKSYKDIKYDIPKYDTEYIIAKQKLFRI